MKSKSHIYMLLMGLFFSVSSCDYLAVSDQMSIIRKSKCSRVSK